MGHLDGKVAIVTGAGRGIGREHALFLAGQGARVVVNDVGGSTDGVGSDDAPARRVTDEIRDASGHAIPNFDDVADLDGASHLVRSAIEEFGQLDILVNNAGILRDRMLVNMSAGEWDAVVRVHLRGHFAPTKQAAVYWREQFKAGYPVKASIVNTSSTSGLVGNFGQANYGAAKAGIAAFTKIVASELDRYGVRVNAIVPSARTRLTEATPGFEEIIASPDEGFDPWDPAHISPVVAYLASDLCPATGAVFFVQGGRVTRMRPWSFEETIRKDGQWTLDELADAMNRLLEPDPEQPLFDPASVQDG